LVLPAADDLPAEVLALESLEDLGLYATKVPAARAEEIFAKMPTLRTLGRR
jgi:hypothetical protein